MSNTDEVIKLHLQEADDLKKKWFSYVFDSIQKLHDKMESNTLQLQKEKEELLKLLMEYRDKLLMVTRDNDYKHSEHLDKLKDNIDEAIEEIKIKLVGVNSDNMELRHLFKTELSVAKQHSKDDVAETVRLHIVEDDKRFKNISDELTDMKGLLTIVKTKVGVYILVISLIISAIVTTFSGGALILFKDTIKSFLGV